MKDLMEKVSYSLLIAIAEFALGLLLLVSPGGFTSAIIIVLAIALIVLGIVGIIGYIRLPREEASKTWKLSAGLAGICVGVSALDVVYFILGKQERK